MTLCTPLEACALATPPALVILAALAMGMDGKALAVAQLRLDAIAQIGGGANAEAAATYFSQTLGTPRYPRT